MTAESKGRDCGSQFSVRLPLLAGEFPTVERTAETPLHHSTSRSFRVLVVEDIKANRFMLVRLLRTMGHEVEEAANDQEGIEKALTFKPEVILSDISMPIMNGHEMAKHVRDEPQLQGVRLVALTGYGQEIDRQAVSASGFDNHIVKPADVGVLANLFAELSAGRSHAKPR